MSDIVSGFCNLKWHFEGVLIFHLSLISNICSLTLYDDSFPVGRYSIKRDEVVKHYSRMPILLCLFYLFEKLVSS